MLRNIIQAVFLAIILTSCQREVSIIQQRPTGDVLLVKTISISPLNNDSLIITYDYDSQERLAKETINSKYSPTGPMLLASSEYIRDAIGRITRVKRIGRSVLNPTVDIISYMNVVYINDTSTKVDHITDDNSTFKTVFTYNTNGKISRIETQQHYPLPSDPLQMVVYFTHQYDALGNLLEKTQYSDWDNNGSFERAITYKFEYDGKVNPVDSNDDALCESRWSLISKENCIKQSNDYADPLSLDDFVTEQFTYRSDGRPQTAFTTGTAGEHYVRTYFYQ
jgi:hypothetical protein